MAGLRSLDARGLTRLRAGSGPRRPCTVLADPLARPLADRWPAARETGIGPSSAVGRHPPLAICWHVVCATRIFLAPPAATTGDQRQRDARRSATAAATLQRYPQPRRLEPARLQGIADTDPRRSRRLQGDLQARCQWRIGCFVATVTHPVTVVDTRCRGGTDMTHPTSTTAHGDGGAGGWLSLQEFCDELGVSPHTAYKWSAAGPASGRFPRFCRLPTGGSGYEDSGLMPGLKASAPRGRGDRPTDPWKARPADVHGITRRPQTVWETGERARRARPRFDVRFRVDGFEFRYRFPQNGGADADTEPVVTVASHLAEYERTMSACPIAQQPQAVSPQPAPVFLSGSAATPTASPNALSTQAVGNGLPCSDGSLPACRGLTQPSGPHAVGRRQTARARQRHLCRHAVRRHRRLIFVVSEGPGDGPH